MLSVATAQSALSNSGLADDPEFFVTLDAYVKYGGDIDDPWTDGPKLSLRQRGG